MLISETYFFRNTAHWDALEQHVVPELLDGLRASPTPLRIWSAGCSSGEEPYSIAMVLMEMGLGHLVGSGNILATDAADEALAAARIGKYGANSFRRVQKERKDRFFCREHRSFVIDPQVVEAVSFQSLNLANSSAVEAFVAREGPFHIVFCRNVLIYFDAALCHQLLDQFACALADGGTLFLGHAEFPAMWSNVFEPVRARDTLLWRPCRRARKTRGPLADIVPETGRYPSTLPVSSPAPLRKPRKPVAAASRSATPADAEPDDLWAQIAETIEHTRFGRAEEAMSAARRLVEEHQLAPEAHYTLGLALEADAQVQSAISAYRSAVFLDSGFAHAHWRSALALATTGQTDAAVAAARWAVRVISSESDARVSYLSDLDRKDLTEMMEQTVAWLTQQKRQLIPQNNSARV